MNQRTEKLLALLKEQDIDAMIIVNPSNRRYLSHFTGSAGTLYISPKKQVLLTDFRYIEQANKQCPDYEVQNHQAKGLLPLLKELMDADHVKNIGIESDTVTYAQYQEYKTVFGEITITGTKSMVEDLRRIKDHEEIECLTRAETIGDIAFTNIVRFIKENYSKGVTENEIALELEVNMRKNGAQGTSFSSIVAAGTKSSLPHAVPGDVLLKEGDFVVMDFGCIYNGYCSDMTRTILIGEPTEKHVEIYNTVLFANQEALKAIKPGKTGKEIDAIARKIIADKGYGDYFGHGLGHSVGLDIHESPRLSVADDTKLEVGMVVTVEPGIYIPNFGGVRIEDLVVVTEDGIENLTYSPKELIVIN
ncbi:MAG TPA: aminopeptidase P family protein [Epulopiscium sp.]|nr:aminopeptidase P family protein [Candidatus Epulonipiscium sp.]